MPTLSKKAALLALAGGTVATLGIFAGQFLGASGSVLESAPRAAIAPALKPAPSLPQIGFLETLPEPDAGSVQAPSPAAKAEPAPVVTAKPEPAPEPKAAAQPSPEEELRPAPEPVAAGSACALGSRPMGDCNCYDEAKGKVTLTLHPTQACVDEESRRLGHRVLLSSAEGHYELAGAESEHEHEHKLEPPPSIEKQVEAARAQAPMVITIPLPEALPAQEAAASVQAKKAPERQLIEFISFGGPLLPPAKARANRPAPVQPPPAAGRTVNEPRPVAPGSQQSETLVMMSRCGIPGHEVHITTASGDWLHIRQGTPLSPALAAAFSIVMGDASGRTYVAITSKNLVVYAAPGGTQTVALASPYQATSYRGVAGFDDMNAAVAYAATLQNGNPVAGSPAPGTPVNPPTPPTPVANPSSPSPANHPGVPHRPRGGKIIPVAKADS